MQDEVLWFEAVDGSMTDLVGGKGAQLGASARIPDVDVPDGFCVTTAAFRRVVGGMPAYAEAVARLEATGPDDVEATRSAAAAVRAVVAAAVLPDDLVAAIAVGLDRSGDGHSVAVRSSATAEDLPSASFAGQHDSFLGVVGLDDVVDRIVRCWASLFTDRAVAYRARTGLAHGDVAMAVVVQRMVDPVASGVLFTADPVSGNRNVATVEAVAGLADALVSGRVVPDTFRVRDGEIVERSPATADGTATLTDDQVCRVVATGRRIEAALGGPQDVEWCLADDRIAIVQSRPITTLFPVPSTSDDPDAAGTKVYVSVGHQQMMTDPMTALGLSMWQRMAFRPMHAAGGRPFVDVTAALAVPAARDAVIGALGRSDPLIGDALRTAVARLAAAPPAPAGPPPGGAPTAPGPAPTEQAEPDDELVAELVAQGRSTIEATRRALDGVEGPAAFDAVDSKLAALEHSLRDPRSMQVINVGLDASEWLDHHVEAWLGERHAADVLTRSAPGNVTSEMGLALLDVADAIRPHPEVVAALATAADEDLPGGLAGLSGGDEAAAAIGAFLDEYGMRCSGEIDLTRPRWSERPSTLVPLLLDAVGRFEPGEAARRFERGRREAAAKEAELLTALRALPDGEAKAEETGRAIERLRTCIGYREFPKYVIISCFALYKRALLAEADRLIVAGALDDREDAFHLTFDELRDAVTTGTVDRELIRSRKEQLVADGLLTPPRVLTSEGEALHGSYRRDDVPAGALIGLGVSAGTVEGRARIVRDMADADLRPGDVLVTTHTDPSWSPLFVAAAGLVTEVGGLMTHGAVVAREYGLPAVVGVEHATELIAEGRRIRVHGGDGFVELLD
ncbi:MAG: phosphoenolpyruvate synthase [Actinobacteria bacterium]|nr:phosphoenolpyruvate synthase [Actinomycetota bacterium]